MTPEVFQALLSFLTSIGQLGPRIAELVRAGKIDIDTDLREAARIAFDIQRQEESMPKTATEPKNAAAPVSDDTQITFGMRVRTLKEWTMEPDVWLRGITLGTLRERLYPSHGEAWDVREALLTPVLDDFERSERVTLMLEPPKGRKGTLYRKMQQSWAEMVLTGGGSDGEHLHLWAQAKAGQRQRDGLRDRIRELEENLYKMRRENHELRHFAAQMKAALEDATAHRGELSALLGWWTEVRKRPQDVVAHAAPVERVFELLTKMFEKPPQQAPRAPLGIHLRHDSDEGWVKYAKPEPEPEQKAPEAPPEMKEWMGMFFAPMVYAYAKAAAGVIESVAGSKSATSP